MHHKRVEIKIQGKSANSFKKNNLSVIQNCPVFFLNSVSNKRSFYCNTIVGNKEKNYHTLPPSKTCEADLNRWE